MFRAEHLTAGPANYGQTSPSVQGSDRSMSIAAEKDPTKVTHRLRFSWGEMYRYLGADFWIGVKTKLKIAMVKLIISRLLVARLSFGYVVLVFVFDINLLSYFWDGCSTFGSRIWFMVLPAMALAWCLRHRHAWRIPRNQAARVVA